MEASENLNPVMLRRRLRKEFRQMRFDTELTQEQIAAATDWSLPKLIRIENDTAGTHPDATQRRIAGRKEAMRSRIRRLLDESEKPAATIGLAPFSAGANPGMQAPSRPPTVR